MFTDVSVEIVDEPEALVINVFMPSGDQWEQHLIQLSEQQVDVLLYAALDEEKYIPGTYRIVGGEGSEVIQESTFELTKEKLPGC